MQKEKLIQHSIKSTLDRYAISLNHFPQKFVALSCIAKGAIPAQRLLFRLYMISMDFK